MGMRVDGREIEITHPEKVLYPADGITKTQVIEYYTKTAKYILPYTSNRPLVMRRFPDGIKAEGFYQKEVGEYFPKWIKTVTVRLKQGGTQHLVMAGDAATLTYLANQAVITPHVWLSKKPKLNNPDRLVFDLDPPDQKHFAVIIKGAQALREQLELAGFKPKVMTSGSKGLHVWAALGGKKGYEAVRKHAREIAEQVIAKHPNEFTIEARKNKRAGKVLIDIARNAYGQTSVTPFALRARDGAPVATTLKWSELDSKTLSPTSYNINNIWERLDRVGDPWQK